MLNMDDDLSVFAATIDGEAEGEPLDAKQAVASSIINRFKISLKVHRPQFGTGTVRSTCLAPWQFSCWNPGPNRDRDRISALSIDQPTPAFAVCISVAQQFLQGLTADITSGCCFYKNTTLPWPHDWGFQVGPVCTFGALSFFNLGETP